MEWNESRWLARFVQVVSDTFPGRVVCIGLQGSRGRGEATPDSDIDMVVILDRLDYQDLARYRSLVDTLPQQELLCGFLSGREELERWDPAELFQFYYDTRPLVGGLEFLQEKFDREDVARAVRNGACAIYHACVHNSLYERDRAALSALYKTAVFTLQAKYYQETGWYVSRHRALLEKLSGGDREILARALAVRAGNEPDLEEDGARLFQWSGELIRGIDSKLQC